MNDQLAHPSGPAFTESAMSGPALMHVDLEAAAIVEHIPDLASTSTPAESNSRASDPLRRLPCADARGLRLRTSRDCGRLRGYRRSLRRVELNGLSVTDPTAIDKRKAEMRVALKDDLARCPGKRITDSMVACFRNARTNAALVACTRW